ncbi:MAG TPA: RIP metalloprotease RseP [Ignavibacteriaceae bacterium]|nr:RIP metalloprotease RseP [Ignavibacteriaceae bacterium]
MEYIIYFAITIGILVFVHEFGHFASAKLTGMRADIFAIGFGKRLFGWNKITGFTFGNLPKDFDGQGNTDYRLCLLPLGGYVKIAGMVDESFDVEFADKEPQPYEFRAKPVWKKVIVISAGVIMNLLLALLIFWGVNYFQGKQIITTTTIGYVAPGSTIDSLGFKTDDKILAINGKAVRNWDEVRTDIFVNTIGQDVNVKLKRDNTIKDITIPRKLIPENESGERFLTPAGFQPAIAEVTKNSPAEKAGVKKGDIFLRINGEKIYGLQQTIDIISGHKNTTMPLVVERGRDTVQLSVTPDTAGLIGVGLVVNPNAPVEYQTYGFFDSFYYGWMDIVNMTDLTFSMVGKVIGGKVAFGKAFGGPVKIAQLAAKSADTGFLNFLFFLALLSLSLAIINIMPFPVLDGGHLIIILIEGVIKKEIPIKVKVAIQNTGFVILLLLMAFIIYNDIMNL